MGPSRKADQSHSASFGLATFGCSPARSLAAADAGAALFHDEKTPAPLGSVAEPFRTGASLAISGEEGDEEGSGEPGPSSGPNVSVKRRSNVSTALSAAARPDLNVSDDEMAPHRLPKLPAALPSMSNVLRRRLCPPSLEALTRGRGGRDFSETAPTGGGATTAWIVTALAPESDGGRTIPPNPNELALLVEVDAALVVLAR